MHVFLTGAVQVGKSTLIDRVLAQLPQLRTAGFRTVTEEDLPDAIGSVYLVGADRGGERSGENRVAIRYGAPRGAEGFPAAFDRAGTAHLAAAEESDLIVMDEIGRLEEKAERFCSRIEELLDGDVPILGVVQRRGDTPLQRRIRSHPRVRLIEVTQENRESLVHAVTALVRRAVMQRTDSAGAFVFRGGGGSREVLMIRSSRKGWGFPKGHVEPGETAEQAAVRETREETGMEIALRPDFRTEVSGALPEERRRVIYFLGTATGGRLRTSPPEVLEVAWQPTDRAASLIRFPQDVPAFRAALDAVSERADQN